MFTKAITAIMITLAPFAAAVATADAAGYDNGQVIVIGEHAAFPIPDLDNDDRLDVRYDVTATGDHIIRECGLSGGTVAYSPIPWSTYRSNWNAYYCQGIDF